ncbi:tyrosine-type recombinase/integrase [Krasilnikovia sp. MM14-A1259]|uniref:tyrosine-type recombinase/integrase n=1 Tax=Krasilnikovia sp. MM14-A1259 TaxID=3373539 RepID=UPI00399C82E3
MLRGHLAILDEERRAWGGSYPDHGKLFCFEDGRQIHPDTITRRFNRLVDRTGLPRITLHGVRHSYATVSINAGINVNALSERIGHSSAAFTMQTYVHRSGDQVRDAHTAVTVAGLIFGKTRTAPRRDRPGSHRGPAGHRVGHRDMKTGPQRISEGPFPVVAGTGFEPATSGL